MRTLLVLSIVSIASMFLVPQGVAGADTSRYSTTGGSATVYAYSDDGVTSRSVFIFANEEVIKQNSGGGASRFFSDVVVGHASERAESSATVSLGRRELRISPVLSSGVEMSFRSMVSAPRPSTRRSRFPYISTIS
jgi:hypothetical protein